MDHEISRGGDGREPSIDELIATLKRAGAALRGAEVPFVLGGGLGAWALGGPETKHDLDLMVKPVDRERALETLAEAGMMPERPPEGWLYKAWDGAVCVDLIFEPRGMQVTDEVLERGSDTEVVATPVRVMAIEDILATKLLALEEHALDYEGLLQIARSLREKVDWGEVRDRTASSPFARAFFVMLEGLGVVEEADVTGPRRGSVVRVVSETGE